MQYEIVAATFARVAHIMRNPVHNGMVEEHGLDQDLEQIRYVIPSADVTELVRDDQLDLRGCESAHHARRQQYDGPDPANQHRCHRAGRTEQTHGTAQTEALA